MFSAYSVSLLLLLLAAKGNQLLAVDTSMPSTMTQITTQVPTETTNNASTTTAAIEPLISSTTVPSTTTTTTTNASIENSDTPIPPATAVPQAVVPNSEVPPIINSEAPSASPTTLAPSPASVIPANKTIDIISTNASEANKSGQEPLMVGVKTFIDLSYPLDDNTLHWPKNSGFKYIHGIDGEETNERNESYYIKSDEFRMAIHTGTHLDAPRHFSKNGWTVDKIPIERLVDVPLQVIDLSKLVKSHDGTYEFIRQDFIDPITNKPLVRAGSVVLVYTGFSEKYFQGEKVYFGYGTNADMANITNMRIPGFSKDAAQFLVDIGVYGVGLDAPSADSSLHHSAIGKYDPVAHTIFNSNNIYILENINNRLSALIDKDVGATLIAAPLPIVGGSGSPVRLVAVTMHSDCFNVLPSNSGASTLVGNKSPTTMASIVTSIVTIATILMM